MAGNQELPELVRPMLAVPGELPPPAQDDAWAYEMKWDGVRAVAYLQGGTVRLMSRNDLDVTRSYPEVASPPAGLAGESVVLDGELVTFDDARPAELRAAAGAHARPGRRRRPPAGRAGAGGLPGLRRPVPGRPVTAADAVQRAAGRAGRAGGRGDALAGATELPRAGRGRPRGQQGDRARGRGGQAADLGVPAGAAFAGLAEGQARPDAGGRDRRLAPGAGAARGRARVVDPRRPRARPGSSTWAASARGSPSGCSTTSRRSWRRCRGRRPPSGTNCRGRRRATPGGWSRAWSARCVFTEWTPDGRLRHPSWRGLRPDKAPGEIRREP